MQPPRGSHCTSAGVNHQEAYASLCCLSGRSRHSRSSVGQDIVRIYLLLHSASAVIIFHLPYKEKAPDLWRKPCIHWRNCCSPVMVCPHYKPHPSACRLILAALIGFLRLVLDEKQLYCYSGSAALLDLALIK